MSEELPTNLFKIALTLKEYRLLSLWGSRTTPSSPQIQQLLPAPNMSTQSEQVLEDNLVAQLVGQDYEQVAVTDEVAMLANLKAQLEAFNGATPTKGEFTKVLHHLNKSAGVFNLSLIHI